VIDFISCAQSGEQNSVILLAEMQGNHFSCDMIMSTAFLHYFHIKHNLRNKAPKSLIINESGFHRRSSTPCTDTKGAAILQ